MNTILVTGAGSGIGLATAQTLAREGFALLLLGRNAERLDQARETLPSPDRHQVLPCDIRDRAALDEALRQTRLRTLYGVVANAGVGGENLDNGRDRWQEVIDINLTGSYHTVQASLPYLLEGVGEEFRKIVFVSSILARLGVPGYSAYCASKAGLLGLMRSLAAELAPENILVNAVCPGWVDTAMAHAGLEGFARALNISREEAFLKAMEAVPLKKMSEPEEVARLIAFLMHETQTSITGQTFDINNGALMP